MIWSEAKLIFRPRNAQQTLTHLPAVWRRRQMRTIYRHLGIILSPKRPLGGKRTGQVALCRLSNNMQLPRARLSDPHGPSARGSKISCSRSINSQRKLASRSRVQHPGRPLLHQICISSNTRRIGHCHISTMAHRRRLSTSCLCRCFPKRTSNTEPSRRVNSQMSRGTGSKRDRGLRNL